MRAAFAASFAVLLLVASAGAFAQQEGMADFRTGQALRYASQGSSKARGLDFSLRYPRSWRAAEADRPNTVQNFVSADGSGSNCNVVIRDSGLNAAQTRTLVRTETIRSQLPEGTIFVAGQATTLDARPAAEIQARQSINRAGTALEARMIMYLTTNGTNIFLLTCVAGGRTAAEADGRYSAYLPLFRQIANSIVFPGQYR
jgi:hypothetical protein